MIVEKIFKVTAMLLIAIGIQYGIVGLGTKNWINFSEYRVENWIIEGLYLTCVISLALKKD